MTKKPARRWDSKRKRLPSDTPDGLGAFDLGGLDPGIAHYVRVLRSQGVETFQSCEGGHGHAYPEPTIEFHGGRAEGPRAFGAARIYGLPVAELRRYWSIEDGEMVGPYWALTFSEKADVWLKREAARQAAVLKAMGKTLR